MSRSILVIAEENDNLSLKKAHSITSSLDAKLEVVRFLGRLDSQDELQHKQTIKKAVAKQFSKELVTLYKKLSQTKGTGSYMERMITNIKNRQLKNVYLSFLSTLDTPQIHKLIKQQFQKADNATDKNTAFSFICGAQ